MKASIKLAVISAVALMGGVANAANVNTVSSAATGSSLILLLKNATDGNYFYSELTPTVSSLRTMAQLQADTAENYSVNGIDATGPLNGATLTSLNGYTSNNLQAYLAGNTADAITWTIMGSKSASNSNNGSAALVVTSKNDFLDQSVWLNNDLIQAANFFGNNFLSTEINGGGVVFTNGVSSTNGWGSTNVNGKNAPISFNGAGFENGAALNAAQSLYLLGTTGLDVANTYKSAYTLTLSSAGVLSYNEPAPVPVPGALWLLGSSLFGFVGISRRRKATAA